jgi:hypothetical protein
MDDEEKRACRLFSGVASVCRSLFQIRKKNFISAWGVTQRQLSVITKRKENE